MKVIITGATGMVGEGVLLECLDNPAVQQVLMVNRRPSPLRHAKLQELLIPDFMQLEPYTNSLTGYDACFFCAGISSVGMKEDRYHSITYDTTLHFAQTLASLNPGMVFTYVSGAHTDGSEKGRLMWARVKGKTENALIQLPFRGEYNFRPGFMKPYPGQKNVKSIFRLIIPIIPLLFPKASLTMQQVGRAMINAVTKGYPKPILEISDIRKLAGK